MIIAPLYINVCVGLQSIIIKLLMVWPNDAKAEWETSLTSHLIKTVDIAIVTQLRQNNPHFAQNRRFAGKTILIAMSYLPSTIEMWYKNCPIETSLAPPLDKMATILQTVFSDAFVVNEAFCISIKISPKFVPKSPIDINSALV